MPEGDEKARTVRRLFDTISPRYDFVNRVMTLGMDVGWRRRTVRELALPAGSRILDLACGTGDLCRELRVAGHRPVGFDFSHGMLLAAKTDAPLVEADILRLPVRDAGAEGATCGFALRNVVSLQGLFAELARVVRPGGRITVMTHIQSELPAKRVELLKELLPSARRIAVLADSSNTGQLASAEAGARRLGVEIGRASCRERVCSTV